MPSVRLDPDHANIAVARSFVADHLDGHATEVGTVAVLLVSELVTNVIDHTEGAVILTVRNGPPVRIEVHDGQAATQAFRDIVASPPPPQATEEHGRGISIVRTLAARVGLDDDPDGGKSVWFEL